MKYTFGTSRDAALRLEEIAKVFNPLASQFVAAHVDERARCAVDLGCGPGLTTDMLFRATGCPRVYGLDKSADFLAMASARLPHCTFVEHDITKVPFPVVADIMYARFVLSHVRDATRVVNRWVTQLTDAGALLVEEVEGIDTDIEVFRTYLSMNETMIASGGASLFVGRELAQADYDAHVLCNERLLLRVANRQAATWFLPNTLTVWRENEVVLEHLSRSAIEAISQELLRIKDQGSPRGDATWAMRRLVLRRA